MAKLYVYFLVKVESQKIPDKLLYTIAWQKKHQRNHLPTRQYTKKWANLPAKKPDIIANQPDIPEKQANLPQNNLTY